VVIPTDIICEKCGGMMVEREGKYGKFLACGNYPKCRNSRPLDEKKSTVKCKKCGEYMVEREGQYGKYLLCPACKATESLAEKVGTCPECGAFISASMVVNEEDDEYDEYGEEDGFGDDDDLGAIDDLDDLGDDFGDDEDL